MSVKTTISGGVCRLTLDNPERKNALSDSTVEALRAGLARAEAAADVQCVVLDSAVEGVFSLGMDLRALGPEISRSPWEGYFDMLAYVDLLVAMVSCAKPLIAQIDGVAVGGGVDLLAACDLAIATDRSGFLVSQLRKGVFPFTTSALLTSKIGRTRFLHWALSGQVYPAQKLLGLGVLAEIVAPTQDGWATPKLIDRLLTYDQATLLAGWRACRFGDAAAIVGRLREVSGLLAINCQAIRAQEGGGHGQG